ncbi:hypothetical protein QJS04_geneDACA018253 [Acorus gramineus]|uniref:Uncharacterized protein n=1 Tax=Acorus gramineus TaxID=55184 RepID=A0AAV9BR33_ACOGR|nr:hypothetical protein QJS04_geneDACA018253 [Acorus gramineus]
MSSFFRIWAELARGACAPSPPSPSTTAHPSPFRATPLALRSTTARSSSRARFARTWRWTVG